MLCVSRLCFFGLLSLLLLVKAVRCYYLLTHSLFNNTKANE